MDNKEELISVPAVSRDSHYQPAGRERLAYEGRVYGVEKRMLCGMLKAIGNPPVQVVLWNGDTIHCTNELPLARVIIHDRASLLRLIVNPELYFGDAYTSGRIELEGNLVEFLESIYLALSTASRRVTWNKNISRRFSSASRNGISQAKQNIHHHYDIGNAFYRLWLDEQMVYTCAYFPTPSATLEEAQIAKMHYVCRKLRLKPGDTVLEAGCGWGSLALFMAQHYGVKVTALNISHEQIVYARAQAQTMALSRQVEFVEEDYRNAQGQFDVFVSVGMLEHVGKEHYGELGGVIDRCLNPYGHGLIHSIGRGTSAPMNPWIERHIFPGAYPPSLREMMGIFEPWRLSVLDVENLRVHYAKTLEHWQDRFEKSSDQVADMFDDSFVRAWRLYLAGSIAAFNVGDLDLFQIVFNRQRSRDIPWTRDYLYRVH